MFWGDIMKKLVTIGLILLTTISLTACTNSKQATDSQKNHTTKVAKKKVEPKKKKATKKKKVEKKDDNTSSSQQQIDQQNKNQKNTPQQNTQPTQQATQQQPSQQNNNISYDENTLTGFLNKYGMSPAAYKTQHSGMSAYDALKSTPDYLETFGEKQTESMMDRGIMDHDGNMTDKGMQWENHTDDQSNQSYDGQ